MNCQKKQKKNNYKSISHTKYLCQYHVIWCPKFRFNVLDDNISLELEKIFNDIAIKYDYEIIEQQIMEDHIHLFIGAKPTTSPIEIIRIFKSISAIQIFSKFPKLKKFYSKFGSLWSKGNFISSIGNVSQETVKKYIQEQKEK
jgi:putative transposase